METVFPLSFIQHFHHVGGLGNSCSDLSKTEAGLMRKGRELRTYVYVCVRAGVIFSWAFNGEA